MPTPVYTESTSAYEFLARWNDGVLAGAHVGFRTKTYKDGVLIADNVSPVQPVAVGVAAGFPLDEILAQLQIDAMVMCDEKQAELDVANQRIADLESQISAQGT